MRHLGNLLRRFGKDDRGVFGVIFGVMAISLVAMAGAVVDFVALQQARNRAQVALDASALALQPRIFETGITEEQLRILAQALVVERVGDERIVATVDDVTINIEEGSLLLNASIDVPTYFVELVGVPSLSASLLSEATRKKLALEVVMVLDNSGSMLQQSRMANLKLAATCATNILFYDEVNDTTCQPVAGAALLENVKVGLVPFTMYVNVGASNASATWIDRNGVSPISNDNFDNDENDANVFTGAVDRLALYDAITNDNWRGCVEARPHVSTGNSTQFYDTDDTTPSVADPRSLYVPLFAPDNPETLFSLGSYNNYTNDMPPSCDRPAGVSNNIASCTQTQTRSGCNASMSNNSCINNTTDSYGFTGQQNTTVSGRYLGPYPASCDCRTTWTWSNWSDRTGTGSNRTFDRSRTCNNGYVPTGLSSHERQERMCKYSGSISYTSGQKGPNADCPYEAVSPLTINPDTIKTSITNMVADGGTNIHEGSVWGFRTLSPGVPFNQGAPYDEATSKVMILMTDGENTAYQANNINGSYYFSAYGYPYNGTDPATGTANFRLGAANSSNAQLVTEMNARTAQACTNAKAAGITIYTIGLATETVVQSTTATVRAMLTSCATGPDYAFFPTNASALTQTFKDIANQLTRLRLAR